MNHLQSLDWTTNASMKKMENQSFSDYFTSTRTKDMNRNPQSDDITIEVDLRLSTLTPVYGRLMNEVYDFFQSEKGQEIIAAGWRASGIREEINIARQKGSFYH